MSANVEIDAINDSDGSKIESLGTGTTDSNGKFSIDLSKTPTTPIRISVTGGTYVSEMDGATSVTNSATLTALVTDPTSIPNPVNVTLATSMLDQMAMAYAAGTTPPSHARRSARRSASSSSSSCKGGVKAGLPCASTTLGGFYGGIPSSGGSGFGGTPTVTSASDIDAFKVGLLSGAVSDCANQVYPSDPGKFFKAIFADASDLIFDGKKSGTTIYIDDPTDTVPLSSTALTTDFLLCLNDFVGHSSVLGGAGIDGDTLSSVVGSIDSGVTNSDLTPKALGLSAGGSGAIATLAFGGHQYLFVAARTSGVVVIDITDPTSASPMIKDWANVSTVLGAPTGGVIPIIGTSSHAQVVVFAYGSKKMALLNADLMVSGDPTSTTDQTGIVDVEFTPTFVSAGEESVSGGSGYVLGGISDPGNHGVWMASVDGYKLLDVSLASPDFTTVYPAFIPSSPTVYQSGPYSAENVGGDIPHGYLLGGYYEAIALVDLTKGPYMMDSTTLALTPYGTYPNVDANSVDSSLQVGVLTFEDTPKFTLLDMSQVTRTDSTTTGQPGTFSLPSSAVATVDFSATGAGATFSGSAVDGTTHLGLLMAGYSQDMGAFQIQDPSTVASGSSWQGASSYSMFHLYSATGLGFSYSEAFDPHAVGSVFNINNAKAYGYLLDGSYTHVLQIDLAAFLAAPQDATGHQQASDPTLPGGSITHYDWTPGANAQKKHVQPENKHPHN
jgi:hypothetical protein